MSTFQNLVAALSSALLSVARVRPGAVPRRNGATRTASGLLLLLLLPFAAQAADYTVTSAADAGPGTLRQAISDANTAGGSNSIGFDPALAGQTITLTTVGDGTFGPSALLVTSTLTIDGGANNITLMQAKPVPTDNAVPGMRLFYVSPSGDLTLTHLSLSGGRANGGNGQVGETVGGAAAGLGGAIVNAGTLQLVQATLSGNQAQGGSFLSGGAGGAGLGTNANGDSGGGPNGGAQAPLSGSAGNGGFGGGGGVGPGAVSGPGGNGGFGGGGGAGLTGAGGRGGFGGGGGGGTAGGGGGNGGFGGGNGGGMVGRVGQGGGGGGGFGGAVFNYGGTVSVLDSTLSGNSARGGARLNNGTDGSGFGGAIFNLNGVVGTSGATIINNIAPQGGGIYNLGDNGVATQSGPGLRTTSASAPAAVTLFNTTLSGSNDGAATPAPVANYVLNTNNSGNGGGVGFAATGQNLVVNSTADTDDGSCDAGNCTLREAINAANATAGLPDVISFSNTTANGATNFYDGSFRTITLNGSQISIADSVTVTGPGANRLAVSGNDASRVFSVIGVGSVRLSGLSIIRGKTSGSGGAGVYVQNGSLVIVGCTFSQNTTTARGGAIQNLGIGGTSTVEVIGSTFSQNSADNAGGAIISTGGGSVGGGTALLSVTNSSFSGNSSEYAGAIDVVSNSGPSTARVINSSFANNTASNSGRDIYVFNGAVLEIGNSILGSGGSNLVNDGSTITSLGYNLSNDGSGPNNGTTDRINTDPLLAPLADNDGPTQTLALLAGSPAIDAVPLAQCSLGTDQRGITRPQGTACDIGAFEARRGNLMAIKTASNASIPVGGTTTFTLSARNLAATADTGGTLTDTVPSRLHIDSVTQNNSLCTTNGQTVSCLLPSLAQNDVATVSIATTALSVGDASNTATVATGAGIDSDPSNDSSTAPVTVRVLDTTPDPFSFPSKTNVALGSYQLSDEVILTSIEFPTPFLVENGMASINGGACTRVNDPVAPGDRLRLCHTASANFSTDTVTKVTVGTFSTSFTSTTLARDITPDAFSFTDTSNQALNSAQVSNEITVSGINDASPISVTGGFYGLHGLPCTNTSGTVTIGQQVRVCHTASGSYSTATNTTLTIGAGGVLVGVSDTFTSTTVPAPAGDMTPDRFKITAAAEVEPNSINTTTVKITGINVPTPVSVSGGGGMYRIGSGAFTSAAGTITNGQTITLQLKAPAGFNARGTMTLTVGTYADDYRITTRKAKK